MTIYCLPGQGSDKRIFNSLEVGPSYRIEVIEYGTPTRGQSMASFAKELSGRIDTTRPFILLGHSLGGMLCVELSEILHPEKTIIISSAKNRNELPYRYRFQSTIPIYKAVPGSVMLAGAKILQPIVEPDRRAKAEIFKSMLGSKNPLYMKRTVEMILTWERISNSKPIYHIHGNSDHTLPIGSIESPDVVVAKGSHMMVLTRAKEISGILERILGVPKQSSNTELTNTISR